MRLEVDTVDRHLRPVVRPATTGGAGPIAETGQNLKYGDQSVLSVKKVGHGSVMVRHCIANQQQLLAMFSLHFHSHCHSNVCIAPGSTLTCMQSL